MAYSPPLLPIITRPLMTRGAIVMVYGLLGSTVMTLQTGWPVLALSATSLPSNVPTKIFPFHAATPRLTTSQHPLTPRWLDTLGSNDHSGLPVLASNALTMLHAVETYITPSMISGVASWPRSTSKSAYQARPSKFALFAVIW